MYKDSMIVKSVAGVLLFLCSFTNLLAVSDQFNINLTVTADTIAPSIPTGLSGVHFQRLSGVCPQQSPPELAHSAYAMGFIYA